MSHDAAEDGFHEVQLSGKQVVFLFMATTVVSVMIFLCGVFVGRGVRAERGGEALDAEAIASNSAPAPVAEAAPPADEPPAPPVDDELSYHKRLQGATPQAEELKPEAANPQPAPTAPPVQQQAPPPRTTGVDVPTAGRAGTWVVQVQALQNRAAASSIVQRLISKGYPAFLVIPPAGSPQIYRVQIGRYNDRREADQVARRLEKEEQFKPDIKR